MNEEALTERLADIISRAPCRRCRSIDGWSVDLCGAHDCQKLYREEAKAVIVFLREGGMLCAECKS